MIRFLEAFLGLYRYRWFRRWKGGHWELWYIDSPFNSMIWLEMSECSQLKHARDDGIRPPLGRCRPTCEDHGA